MCINIMCKNIKLYIKFQCINIKCKNGVLKKFSDCCRWSLFISINTEPNHAPLLVYTRDGNEASRLSYVETP